ncbi:hypothetical protein [Oceanospirillum phage vB_OsaM_PD0307]|nr:hypothetical protein [Oceanospirillum phage vB_OsaM_PD0307]
MIKIEFPADRTDIALAIGQALVAIGQGKALVNSPAPTTAAETRTDSPAASSTACDDQLKTLDEQAVADLEAEEAPNDTEHPAAQSATVTTGSGEGAANAAGASQTAPSGGSNENVDEKGVPFNPELCSKAAIPFYGSGKKKGQWKKRQGVDEDLYDEWYAEALLGAKVETVEDTAQNETTSDSNVAANAFGNQQQAAADENVPQDAGQLMKWVSEQQAAGNISQQQVTDAYTALQLPFDAVMNPAYPVADNCAAIYNHMKGQI